MERIKETLKQRYHEITGKIVTSEFDITESGFCSACQETHPDRQDGVVCEHCNIVDLIDIYQWGPNGN